MKTLLPSTGSVCLAMGLWVSLGCHHAHAGSALAFDGSNDWVGIGTGLFPLVTNTFTIELWANPAAARASTSESSTGASGAGGQRYAIFPDQGQQAYGSASDAGVGISVGTNGVSLFEHSSAYLPSPLVYSNGVTGWTHIAVVYSNGLPRLYLNGTLARTGLASGKTVHPSANLALGSHLSGYNYGYFQGMLDDVRIWAVALEAVTIQNWFDREVDAGHPAYASLAGYWRLNESGDTDVLDASDQGHHGTLQNGAAWVTPGAPINGPGAPGAFGLTATELNDATAKLNGMVNPQGQAALVWFEWGISTNYESATPPQELAAGESLVAFASTLTGLSPLTTYYFRLAASNSVAVFRTLGKSFKTFGPPAATTLPLTNASFITAALQGAVNPNGHVTLAWFEWGVTTNYGMLTATQNIGASTNQVNVSAMVSVLAGAQQYHYRLVATNSSGWSMGQDQSFQTQSFSNSVTLTEPANESRIFWADYDNDGWLDLLALRSWATNGSTVLYHNATGGSGLAPVFFGPVASYGGADWGDYDNDGQPDFVLSSESSWQAAARVFRNNQGTFTDVGVRLPSLRYSSVAWGDFDNDGDLDLVISGSSYPFPTTRVYRNENGSFTDIAAGLPGVGNGSAAWGDFDNDGHLDLLLMGDTGQALLTRVYRNTNSIFTDIAAGLPGVTNGSSAWGDFNRDGLLDILLTGTTQDGTNIARIYRNTNGAFVDANVGLIPVQGDKAAWADFDNDGRLDVILGGRVFRNEGNTFSALGSAFDAPSPLFPACADYDNDGLMDFGVAVSLSDSRWQDARPDSVKLYRSLLQSPHAQIPPPPTGLTATVVSNGVRLAWLTPEGGSSPTNGLTYNVRLWATPGNRQIVPSHSDPTTGRRLLPRMGNAQCRLFSTFTNLPVGIYYWSVQSVNGSFVGSPWAGDQTFIVTNGASLYGTLPASNVLCCSGVLNGVVTLRALETSAWFEWGMTTDFGNVTPVQHLGTGLLPVLVTHQLSGLQPLTGLFFRLVSSNSSSLTLGETRGFTTELPAPLAVALSPTNITCTTATLLGSPLGGGAPANHFVEWGSTASYGNLAPVTYLNATLRFDGSNDSVLIAPGRFPDITNNFTIELWVNPTANRTETVESADGIAGISGQRYAVFPEWVGEAYGSWYHVGAGLSVGLNGVSVVEHSGSFLPTVLVLSNQLSGWFHLALTYSNGLPRLYLNGTLARTGLASGRIVHPSAYFGSDGIPSYGAYAGGILDVRIWDLPLDANTIRTWMNQTVTPQHPTFSHLQGYWPLNEGQGLTVTDLSPRGNTGQLVNGPIWTAGWQTDAFIFAATLAGLTPGTEYHFRSFTTNGGGTAYGEDQTFTTLPRPSVLGVTVQTSPATAGSLLRFSGSPGFGYVMEASTNLVDWLALTNLVAGSDGLFEFLDPSATNLPTRFYRLRVP